MEHQIAPRPPRQRWRLYVSQPAAAAPGGPAAAAPGGPAAGVRGWHALLAASGLPIAGESASRGRVVPAAPLPLGISGEHEIVDVFLGERLSAAAVRTAVGAALPPGWSLVGLHDVWVGAPAAPASVVAADYRVVLRGPSRVQLEVAARELLAAATLPRERRREKRTISYDLRRLLIDLQVRATGAAGVTLGMRLRHGPDAAGRPEEVVGALAEPPAPPLDAPPQVVEIVRERLLLADDPDVRAAAGEVLAAS